MFRCLICLSLLSVSSYANGIHQITFGNNIDNWPSWSQDGSKIVFQRELISTGYIDLFIKYTYNSSPATRLTNDLNSEVGACWSPDGTKIAFSTTRNGSYGTWIKDVQTLEEWYFCDGTYPSWSSVGNFIAYNKESGSNWNIWKKDITTGEETQLTFEAGQNAFPDVSTDGTKIVFEHGDVDPGIWVVSSQGGTVTQLPIFGYRPNWSPDGSKICFDAGAVVTGIFIYIYDLSTGEITNTHVEGMNPDWSVQGDKIAYQNFHTGNLYYMDYPFVQKPSTLGKIKAMYKDVQPSIPSRQSKD